MLVFFLVGQAPVLPRSRPPYYFFFPAPSIQPKGLLSDLARAEQKGEVHQERSVSR